MNDGRELSDAFVNVININRISSLLSRPFFQRYAQEYRVTLNEWRVLATTYSWPNTAGQDVARLAGLHPMNVSRTVASLKRDGRLVTVRDPDDHRRQLIRLTEAGEALYEELFPHARAHAQQLFEIFDDEERERLGEMLSRLYARAEEVLGGGDEALEGDS